MRRLHIPDVLKSGCFVRCHMYKVLEPAEAEPTYLLQYDCRTMEDYHRYRDNFAPALQKVHAERYAVDAVLCGHIHSAGVRQIGAITYYNCGDWVESCSALVEDFDGAIELLNFNPFQDSSAGQHERPELAESFS